MDGRLGPDERGVWGGRRLVCPALCFLILLLLALLGVNVS